MFHGLVSLDAAFEFHGMDASECSSLQATNPTHLNLELSEGQGERIGLYQVGWEYRKDSSEEP